MECDITFEKPVLKDREEIARLLSSPAFLIRATTSAERYCNEEQNKNKLNDYTTTTPLY